nr:hypothetical protein GCM10010200_051240 [Actinomadura rugatobispora]
MVAPKGHGRPLALYWFAVISMLIWAAIGLGAAVRDSKATARFNDGEGREGVFIAAYLHCSRGSQCSWYGSFIADRSGIVELQGVELRGVDDGSIERGTQVAALDVDSRDFVYAVGGSADNGTLVGASMLTLLLGVPGAVLLPIVIRQTPWSRLPRFIDLARSGRAAVARLVTRDRWGPLARPGSPTMVPMARSRTKTLLWLAAVPLVALLTWASPQIALEILAFDPHPEEVVAGLWMLISVAPLLALVAVQILRMAFVRPRVWLSEDDFLIWDSVLLWKVARIRRADIAGVHPIPRARERPESGGADLSPFRERLNLSVLFREDIVLPGRRLRWGNWIWRLGADRQLTGPPWIPRRGEPYRGIALRVRDPEEVAAGLNRWLAQGHAGLGAVD